MTRFDDIDDVDTLRQVAKLQAQEIDVLHTRLAHLVRELSTLRGTPSDPQLKLELEQLQQRLAVLQKTVFAPSTEKRKTGGARIRTRGRAVPCAPGTRSSAPADAPRDRS